LIFRQTAYPQNSNHNSGTFPIPHRYQYLGTYSSILSQVSPHSDALPTKLKDNLIYSGALFITFWIRTVSGFNWVLNPDPGKLYALSEGREDSPGAWRFFKKINIHGYTVRVAFLDYIFLSVDLFSENLGLDPDLLFAAAATLIFSYIPHDVA
jgi:hypothetical protein